MLSILFNRAVKAFNVISPFKAAEYETRHCGMPPVENSTYSIDETWATATPRNGGYSIDVHTWYRKRESSEEPWTLGKADLVVTGDYSSRQEALKKLELFEKEIFPIAQCRPLESQPLTARIRHYSNPVHEALSTVALRNLFSGMSRVLPGAIFTTEHYGEAAPVDLRSRNIIEDEVWAEAVRKDEDHYVININRRLRHRMSSTQWLRVNILEDKKHLYDANTYTLAGALRALKYFEEQLKKRKQEPLPEQSLMTRIRHYSHFMMSDPG